jgi:hypothetical protein
MEFEQTPTIEQKESIKLIKNSKGYNWEIRVLDLDIEKLDKMNNEMLKRYGEAKD